MSFSWFCLETCFESEIDWEEEAERDSDWSLEEESESSEADSEEEEELEEEEEELLLLSSSSSQAHCQEERVLRIRWRAIFLTLCSLMDLPVINSMMSS